MHSSRPPLLTATVFGAAVALGAASAPADTVNVYIFDREYSQNNPQSVPPTQLPNDPTINVGDTVRWVLVGGFHTVDSCSGMTESFSSGPMFTAGAAFDHTFTQAGSFGYYCQFHGFDNGNGTGGGMAGVVTVQAATPACPADLGEQGGAAGQDARLDNNDFIAFISLFFAADIRADLGAQGGLPGRDGAFDNNDFIAFISLFFNGCP
ncbi:MAG: hypothetical protein K2Q09_10625 [Phycisphaerales bacterium]|nr:hypothetical protein [Phycisphaerales bacterium]